MCALARGLHQLAHALWGQPGSDGLPSGPVKRLHGGINEGLIGVDGVWGCDLVRGWRRWSLPDGDGANDRVIIATVDVIASRIRMLTHVHCLSLPVDRHVCACAI